MNDESIEQELMRLTFLVVVGSVLVWAYLIFRMQRADFWKSQIVAFEKPVAYVHGDSHYFRVDKPFLDDQGRRLENFTRVETYGDNQSNGTNDVNWLKVYVNSASREVFAYQPQIVSGNRTAVAAP